MEITNSMFVRHRADIRTLVPILFVVCSTVDLFGQLQQFPLPPIPLTGNESRSRESGRVQQAEPLSLPFWDDFSNPYLGQYPDPQLWKIGTSVSVNSGMGVNPRTIFVATFDGLDSAGVAYNPQEIFLKGFTDSLVSQPLNLGSTGDKPVLPEERNSVFLSFFYQWKGNGEAPDAVEDYLQVQFLNDQNAWVTVFTVEPEESLRSDTFYTAMVQVQGDEFFHEEFQLRFRSFGRQSGPYDTWNLDYVYLNKGRDASDLAFPDRAVSSSLGTFLGRYRSMPLSHFNINRELTTPSFDISNLQNNPASANYRARMTVKTFNGGLPEGNVINLGDSIPLEYVGSEPSGFLPALSRKKITTLPLLDDSYIADDADSVYFDAEIILNSGDNVYETETTGDYTAAYEPIDFRSNDTIRSHNELSTYYAYDDGEAEYAAGLIETGNLVAYQFDMPFNDSYPQDTLIAFDIYFPPYGITSNQTVDFFVYHDDGNGMPGEVWLRIPSRRIVRSGINQFQRVRFIPALLIDEEKFYIGWKEPVAGNLLVGLDISNDTGDKMFVNTNNFWTKNGVVHGSLMIRPVFGSGQVDTQVGIVEEPAFHVYPNPSTGTFVIDGIPDEVQILSVTGNSVPFQSDAEDNRIHIQINQAPGLYILRVRSGARVTTHKIVIGQY